MADDLSTRLAWQMLGEHVLSAARHAATGRIGLRTTPGGVGTPRFPRGDGERCIRIDGTELVVDDDGAACRAPVTTLAAAGEMVGITPGAPVDVYTPSSPLELERDLGEMIDPDAAARLAAFYALAQEALSLIVGRHAAAGPAEIQLWPEHFDLATTIGEVNLGASPGDAAHDGPYFYVGPWVQRSGAFWNEPFGASRSVRELATAEGAAAFLDAGLAQAATDPVRT